MPKIVVGCDPLLGGEGVELGPHLIQSCLGRGLPPYQVVSGILIHPAVWLQRTWAENWGTVQIFWGELGPDLTQRGRGRGLPARHVSS